MLVHGRSGSFHFDRSTVPSEDGYLGMSIRIPTSICGDALSLFSEYLTGILILVLTNVLG